MARAMHKPSAEVAMYNDIPFYSDLPGNYLPLLEWAVDGAPEWIRDVAFDVLSFYLIPGFVWWPDMPRMIG
jgi:hypothetical protein